MKNLLLVFAALCTLEFAAAGCKTIQYVPVETIKEVYVKDSVYVRDTLVRIELEKARLSDFVDIRDSLVLTTDLARSVTFIDTTRAILRGTIENIKPYVEKPIPVQHKIEYRDTVITKEVPVPVEVPKPYVPMFWIVCSVIGLGAVALLFLWLISKF